MDIKDFVDSFITTYRLAYNAKLKNYDYVYLSNEYNTFMEIYPYETNIIVVRIWISNEDKAFIDILDKIHKINPDMFTTHKMFRLTTVYSRIILNANDSSNLEWYNEILDQVGGEIEEI